jgi:hypothetical protein
MNLSGWGWFFDFEITSNLDPVVLYKINLNQHNTYSNFKPATWRNKDYLFHEVPQRKLHLIL